MVVDIGQPERTPNRTGDPPQPCQHCGDTAQVLVQTRPAAPSPVISTGQMRAPSGSYDEMGPCPYCESGLWLEFGIGRRYDERTKKLVEYRNPKPPWGSNGYWRGRVPVYEEMP